MNAKPAEKFLDRVSDQTLMLIGLAVAMLLLLAIVLHGSAGGNQTSNQIVPASSAPASAPPAVRDAAPKQLPNPAKAPGGTVNGRSRKPGSSN